MTASEKPTSQNQPDTLAVLALIFGIVSFTGPGLLLGIPAIVLASIALKKNLAGRSLSIAGLVTGIVSTVLSLLFIALLVLIFVWEINNSNSLEYYDEYPAPQHQEPASQEWHT